MGNISLSALPLIGLIGGFLSGLLGLGGGVIMLPLLTFVGGIPLKLATGISLAHVMVSAAAGVVAHFGLGGFRGCAGCVGGRVRRRSGFRNSRCAWYWVTRDRRFCGEGNSPGVPVR